MIRSLAAGVLGLVLALPAAAQDRAADLWEALRLDEVIAVMRQEGTAYGESLEEELFPGRGGASWDRAVADIHRRARMRDWVSERFASALAGVNTTSLLDFFTGDLGREIVALEIDARRAIRDTETEQEAIAAFDRLARHRRERIETFVAANDLLDQNVVGAMNANYAFYSGLADGGAFGGEMTEERILNDVWASAPGIRAESRAWLLGYLGLAYRPLSDAELDRYIAVSESDAGQELNAALFAAFDGLYARISRDLGRRAAGYMQGEEL